MQVSGSVSQGHCSRKALKTGLYGEDWCAACTLLFVPRNLYGQTKSLSGVSFVIVLLPSECSGSYPYEATGRHYPRSLILKE